MYIGEKLRKLRDKSQLSQEEVAIRLGVSQSTVWNWENNASHFKLDHLPKLAELLQVDVADLLPEGAVVNIVNYNENKDNSVNGFEIKMENRTQSDRLLKSLEETILLLKEQNQALKEENNKLKTVLAKRRGNGLMGEV